jgi:hypothetical protein
VIPSRADAVRTSLADAIRGRIRAVPTVHARIEWKAKQAER